MSKTVFKELIKDQWEAKTKIEIEKVKPLWTKKWISEQNKDFIEVEEINQQLVVLNEEIQEIVKNIRDLEELSNCENYGIPLEISEVETESFSESSFEEY